MSTEEHLRDQDVAALAALASTDPERVRAEAHAARCPPCARALAQGARLVALLDALPATAGPSPALLERAASPARRDLGAAAGGPRGVLAAIPLAWLTVLALESRHGLDPHRWTPALLALAAALAVGWASRLGRTRRIAALGAVAVSAGLACGAADRAGALAPMLGLRCAAIELFAAALPLGAVVLLARRDRLPSDAHAWAAVAAAGALAGQGALAVACPARGASVHLLAFHLAAVVCAALGGAALARVPARGV